MSEEIHGHDVMEMVMASDKAFTVESLEVAIHEKFGVAARFYTCSASNMTARELIAFLDERGKFISRGDGFTTDPARVCNHDEGHDHH